MVEIHNENLKPGFSSDEFSKNLLPTSRLGGTATGMNSSSNTSRPRSAGVLNQHPVEKMTARSPEHEVLQASLAAQNAEIEELRRKCGRLEVLVHSAEQWQKSWFRRVFFRWHSIPDRGRRGVGGRLVRSLRKRFGSMENPIPREESKVDLPPETAVPVPESVPEAAPPPVPDERQAAKEAIRLQLAENLQRFLQGEARVQLRHSETPKISILIVLFNQAEFTLACLQALEKETGLPIEVIAVDNGSEDDTARLMERVEGVDLVCNRENRGFLRAVNQAAARARGEHILLLNNDALPRPGSLTRALEALEESTDIAAVGARLVRPDGTLQEAGNVIWSNGRCRGYGRDLPEASFEVMFRRDVDYCSAAFLLLRRAVFEALGGFDESFAPAYFEESDLAMTLYENGYRVVYEPLAVVDHFEFASSEDLSATQDQMKKNQLLFQAKHQDSLRQQRDFSSQDFLQARSRKPAEKRVLFLDSLLPLPANGSGCPRALEMVKALQRQGFFVTFWPLADRSVDWDGAYQVVPREVELVLGRKQARLQDFLKEREGFYNILLVSRPPNMQLVSQIRESSPHLFANLKIIYDAEAVYAARHIKRAEVLGLPLKEEAAESLIQDEIELCRDVDAIAVTSRRQSEYFSRAGCRNVNILSHCVPRHPGRSGFARRSGFLFVGRLCENESPNADSLLWFALKVLPILRQRLGREIPVNVIGANEGLILKRFGDSSFRFHGARDNLDDCYDSARVFIAPTRFASGIPLKILEAAAYGVPVVATRFLAELLDWSPGEQLLASDDPEEFAENCIRLHEDEVLWSRIRERALSQMEVDHSPAAFGRDLAAML